MLSLSKTLDTAISIESAAARLTETILGNDHRDLAETLTAIVSDIGLAHISYVRLSPDKSADMCLLVAVVASLLGFGSTDTLSRNTCPTIR